MALAGKRFGEVAVVGLSVIVFAAADATVPVAVPVVVARPPTPLPMVVAAPPPPTPVPTSGMPTARDPHDPWPQSSPNGWVTLADYPAQALKAKQRGVVRYTLVVGADGRVTGCSVTMTSGVPELDDACCRLVSARARFAPATDADGRAIGGSYRGYAFWVPPIEAPEPGQFVVDYYVETDGNPSFCEVKSATGAFAGKARVGLMPCPTQPFAHPYADASGKPVRRHVTMTTTVAVDDAPN